MCVCVSRTQFVYTRFVRIWKVELCWIVAHAISSIISHWNYTVWCDTLLCITSNDDSKMKRLNCRNHICRGAECHRISQYNESRTYLFSSVQFCASQLHQVRPFWTRNCVLAWFVAHKTMVIIIILLAWVCDHCSIPLWWRSRKIDRLISPAILSLLSK